MTGEEGRCGAGEHGGLFASLKTLAATVLSIGHTRLELLSVELEEERLRLTSMLLWALFALFCAGLGIVLLAMLFVVALWDSNRLLALAIPALLFLLGATLSWRVVRAKAAAKPGLFSASLAELSKDREQLAVRP